MIIMETPEIEHGDYSESELFNWFSVGTNFLANKNVHGNLGLTPSFGGTGETRDKVIKNCVFNNGLHLEYEGISRVIFTECSFKEDVRIKVGTITETLSFVDCEFDGILSLYESNSGWIQLDKCLFNGDVSVSAIVDTCIQTTACEFKKGFRIHSFEGHCHLKQLVLVACKLSGSFFADYSVKINHLSSDDSQFNSVVLRADIDDCLFSGKETQ